MVSFVQALKLQAEKVTLLPGIKVRIPLGVKLTAASLLIPGAPAIVGKVAARALPIIGRIAKAFIPKTPLGIGAAVVGTGILTVSPTARKAVVELPKTLFTGGQVIGEKIEELPEAVEEKAGKFGLVGLSAAAIAALIAGALLVKEKIPKVSVPKISRREKPSEIPPVALIPAPPSLTSTTPPLGAVEKPVEEIAAIPIPVKQRPINIKNTFNPTIDISFRKSRRFINQQILVR